MSVAIIDSGVANLASVSAALRRLGVEAEITCDAAQIRKASYIILPGVGSAAAAMAQLNKKGLIELLPGLTQPVLGICLGMQLLFAHSEESGGVDGLNIIQGNVCLLPAKAGMPIPHMGWNQIKKYMPDNPLLKNIPDKAFVYFVHSYAAPVGEETIATCDYSAIFTAVVGHKNFFGCQFHPERSGAIGAQILQNFLGI